MKGCLIAISGSDGVGKATQTKKLVDLAKKNGYSIETMSFPRYETETGKKIKGYLDGKLGKPEDLSPYSIARLYAEDRKAAKDEISMKLMHTNLILDRYVTDNLAYQGARRLGEERLNLIRWIQELEYGIIGLPRPDLILFLYLPLSFSKKAVEERGREKDIHETNDNYLKAVGETFLIMDEFEENFNVITCSNGEGRLSVEDVTKELWEKIEKVLVR